MEDPNPAVYMQCIILGSSSIEKGKLFAENLGDTVKRAML